jgi:hypothetical protein
MELAAQEPTESVTGDFTNADQAIAACDTFEEFAAASAMFPHALDGFDPRSIAQDRCERADELAAEPLCDEVGPLPCDPGFVCTGALLPGEYTSTSTGAVVDFTLTGEGWIGREDSPGSTPGGGDGFALYNDAVGPDGPATHAISVVPYTGEVYALVCSPDTVGTAAMDFITFLSGRDGVQAEEPVDTEVGGRPAVRLDLTTNSPCPYQTGIGKRMWMWVLPTGGDFHLDDDSDVRVYEVDAGCVTLAIVIEAFPAADYDVLLEKAEEVIATMTVQPTC